ncbi:arsenic transporter [Mucilaginibacter gotjawali]|uniref:Arsenical pump membrane protein n=2 Tax=Mucilaginibacter gotjawali TaxID=1550579 RepID=A0A0X8X9C5_9SPHI|nr:arsenic transporter [Mucilaginibacter gotjawali]MBB3059040.1 arsenical pump membrane protein [Mucilaginibacter gotjawali]BAU55779.1 Arsenical pump membrane protein [Mucilaginibacter gotjawali]
MTKDFRLCTYMSYTLIRVISVLAIAGVIIRPFKLPEAVWAVAGAVLLVLLRQISPTEALTGLNRGTDVYLFLTGMMLLAETAREEKLFDWLAAHATVLAKGSSTRLFLLIYLVGIIVTVFLSNDATAVVLTPAVAAAVRAANVKNPLPYLLICAFIANAASFVLPISNPANLVIYGSHMPPLLHWLRLYFLPSLFAIAATYLMLYLTQRTALKQQTETDIQLPTLSRGGKTALYGILGTAVVLLIASAMDLQLGLPTAITGILTSAIVIISARKDPRIVIKGVTWSVLPLVGGLFIIVEALYKTGLIHAISQLLDHSAAHSAAGAAWGSSFSIAIACNLANNLPVGLVAGNAIQVAHLPEMVKSAILIGVDLGPNLSITGSLATILWLVALRREGHMVSAWAFLKIGFFVMMVALLLAIGSLWL